MADDLGGVLREVSALLQRLTEQNDAATRQREEDRSRQEGNRERWETQRSRMEEASKRWQTFNSERPDPKKQAEEMRSRMEESRIMHAKQREEDVQFRQQLLYEIERHNRLLETLIAKLAERTADS